MWGVWLTWEVAICICVWGVANLVEDVPRRVLDPLPVDHPGLQQLHELRERDAVLHVLEEVGDVALDAERVDPHAEGALLAVVLVVVGQLDVHGLEAGARVEERGTEAEVELLRRQSNGAEVQGGA